MARIIVTGGFGALGRALCAELAARGHALAVVDLAPAPADFSGVAFAAIDLTDEVAVTKAYADAAQQMGGIDGVVNVAGGFLWERMSDGAIGTWDDMYKMNVRTAALSCRAALPHLKAGSAIVNIGAAGAANAASGMAPYAASKAGVLALTQGLADELRGKGIRVNAVLPTILDTPANRRDMPDADTSQWVQPQAAAKVIAFLLSDEAACITGQGLTLSARG